MGDDFRAALARIQSDYAFFIHCQSDPDTALAGYSLTPQERATLADPAGLADALKRGTDLRLPTITIKISGTHDWVNASPQRKNEADELAVAAQVESIRAARSDEQREESTLRLIQLIG